jgi:site-specific recombinase XerD
MSVKLRKRKNSDGTTTLYLDIYFNGERKYEFLKHLKLSKGTNPADKQTNKDNTELAKKIAINRAQQLSANDYNMVTDIGKKTIVAEWMQNFIDKYQKKDKRNLQGALNRFTDFLKIDGKTGVTFGSINEVLIERYQDYLRQHSKGEGASSYFTRFKKMMKQAKKEKLMLENPAEDVKTKQGKARQKDILTLEEIKTLFNTNCQSDDVKRAALFSCVTGLRWIDVSTIKWKNVNLKNRYMINPQSKTEQDVYINLNDRAIELLGKAGNPDELIFNLPTANGANKTVKAWVKRAGITKKITWHNFRHSFGTNLIFYGADVTTASNLLGHSTLKHTQRYVKAANELKERATDNLNF